MSWLKGGVKYHLIRKHSHFLTKGIETGTLDLSGQGLSRICLPHHCNPTCLFLAHNAITKIESLEQYSGLQQLSLADNKVVRMNGVSILFNLTVLNLSQNSITHIEGLRSLTRLKWLSLSNNKIKLIENLSNSTNLEHLDLSQNSIITIADISNLRQLKTLLLHGNSIATLRTAPNHLPTSLVILLLGGNQISDLNEVAYLSQLTSLEQLSIIENPCVCFSENQEFGFDYRPFVVNWCMTLQTLDGFAVTEKEGLKAEWLYSQGKGRHHRPGQHAPLLQYLATACPPTAPTDVSLQEDVHLNRVLQQQRLHQLQLEEETSGHQLVKEEFLSHSPNLQLTPSHSPRATSQQPVSGISTPPKPIIVPGRSSLREESLMASPQTSSQMDSMASQHRGSPRRAWYSRPNTADSSRPGTAPGATERQPLRPHYMEMHLQDIASGDESTTSMLDAETRYLPLHSELSCSPVRPLNLDYARRPQTAPPASDQSHHHVEEPHHHGVSASVAEGHQSRADQADPRRVYAGAANSRLAANFGHNRQQYQQGQPASASSSIISHPVKPTISDTHPQPHAKRSKSPMARPIDLQDSTTDQLSSVNMEKFYAGLVADRKNRGSPRPSSLDMSGSVSASNPAYKPSSYSPDKYKTPTRQSVRKSAASTDTGSAKDKVTHLNGLPSHHIDSEKPEEQVISDMKEETFAITKLQALWRGYRARNVDPDVIHVRQEMRLRRSEDHIRHLKSQLESATQLKTVLIDVIRFLCNDRAESPKIPDLTDVVQNSTMADNQQLMEILGKVKAMENESAEPKRSAASPIVSRRVLRDETNDMTTSTRASSYVQTSMSTTDFKNLEKDVSELKNALQNVLSDRQSTVDTDHVSLHSTAEVEKPVRLLEHYNVVSLTNSLRDPIKPGVPTTPTRLAVQNTTSSSLVLQWEPSVVLNSDGKPANKAVLGYRLYVNGQPRRMITMHKVEIDGLLAGTTYEFCVRAIAELGESRESNKVVVTMDGESLRLMSHDHCPDDSDKDHDSADEHPPPNSTSGSSNSGGTSTSGSLPGSGDSPECGQGGQRGASHKEASSGRQSLISGQISPSGSSPSSRQTSPHTTMPKSQPLKKSPAQMRLDFSGDGSSNDSGLGAAPCIRDRLGGLLPQPGDLDSPGRRVTVRDRLEQQRKVDPEPLIAQEDTEKVYSPRMTDDLVKRMGDKKIASKMLRPDRRKAGVDATKPMPMRAFKKEMDTGSGTIESAKEDAVADCSEKQQSLSKIPVKAGKSGGSHPNSRRSSYDSDEITGSMHRASSADSIVISDKTRASSGSQERLAASDTQTVQVRSRGSSRHSSGSSPERDSKTKQRYSSGDSSNCADVLRHKTKKEKHRKSSGSGAEQDTVDADVQIKLSPGGSAADSAGGMEPKPPPPDSPRRNSLTRRNSFKQKKEGEKASVATLSSTSGTDTCGSQSVGTTYPVEANVIVSNTDEGDSSDHVGSTRDGSDRLVDSQANQDNQHNNQQPEAESTLITRQSRGRCSVREPSRKKEGEQSERRAQSVGAIFGRIAANQVVMKKPPAGRPVKSPYDQPEQKTAPRTPSREDLRKAARHRTRSSSSEDDESSKAAARKLSTGSSSSGQEAVIIAEKVKHDVVKRKVFTHRRSSSDISGIKHTAQSQDSSTVQKVTPPSTPTLAPSSPRVRRSSSFSKAGEKESLLRKPMSIATLKATANEERRQAEKTKPTTDPVNSSVMSGGDAENQQEKSYKTNAEKKTKKSASYPNSCESSPDNTAVLSFTGHRRSQSSSQVHELMKGGGDRVVDKSQPITRKTSLQERGRVARSVDQPSTTEIVVENTGVDCSDLSSIDYTPKLQGKPFPKNKGVRDVFKKTFWKINSNKS